MRADKLQVDAMEAIRDSVPDTLISNIEQKYEAVQAEHKKLLENPSVKELIRERNSAKYQVGDDDSDIYTVNEINDIRWSNGQTPLDKMLNLSQAKFDASMADMGYNRVYPFNKPDPSQVTELLFLRGVHVKAVSDYRKERNLVALPIAIINR